MLEKFWYGKKNVLSWCLWPLSLIYIIIIRLRRIFLTHYKQQKFKTPVIVIGNITVGGVGKTPLVIELTKQCIARNLKVGIVSRGYGALFNISPYEVKSNDIPQNVGDEPLLIAQKTGCPVIIARARSEAVLFLEKNYQVDIIISDDGLQHYAMGRILEIAIIDGSRGLGNGFCMPSGPLREQASRLKQVHFVIVHGKEFHWPHAYDMSLKKLSFKQLVTDKSVTVKDIKGSIAAIAAIGNPQRFFDSLTLLGLDFQAYPFPDHHSFTAKDLEFKEQIVIMTEKDAVKCRSFAHKCMYYLPVEASLSEEFWNVFWSHEQLRGILKDV